MRWIACFLVARAWAAGDIGPRTLKVRQGEVLRLEYKEVETARMNGRTVRLFPETNGERMGLMPAGVLDKPGEYPLELMDEKGTLVQTETVTVLDAHYAKQNLSVTPAIATLKASPGEQDTFKQFRKEILSERYWGDRLELPVPGCLTSVFGSQRLFNGKPTGDFHAGLDQRGAAGTPIHAVAGGLVKVAHEFNLRGGTVAIDHGQGLQSEYLHMSKVAAKEGDQVKAGDVIGFVGATGRATGPHLHWTLYANGVPVNPAQWVDVPAACKPAARKNPVRPKRSKATAS